MPEVFKIRGGKSLAGEIVVRGSKNAALPLIAATLLTDEECVLTDVPRIRDVENLLHILNGLGSEISWGNDGLRISNARVVSYEPDPVMVRKLRGSVLLAGALLGRFGKVSMPFPGGDQIGARPLDAHFAVFHGVLATVSETQDHFLHIAYGNEVSEPAHIVLPEASVTATENALMAAALRSGETVIKIAATEPHVQDLARFLSKMGVSVEGAGTN
ncbi:MAG: UDP-N-acetylglucosamine 1-carboxyvinyltransferase, partial [Parcubacteria group bacterium]|nr:UDP-N-acetylglucosamine 1-carboxyvinyltransferase [Parcubacteria group bacterium]